MSKIVSFLIILVVVELSVTQITSEEILIKNGEIQLPGTLTYNSKNSPLVIWVHGSGNIDRNGNQPGTIVKAAYIKQFREAINKAGIAFFSYDKRTANPKNKLNLLEKGVVFNDFILDAKTVISYLKNNYSFSEIIVIGHSQGSLTAMKALKDADKFISISGTGETIDKTIVKQISKQNVGFGKIAKAHFSELDSIGTITNVNPFLQSVFNKRNQPFLVSWMQLNPTEILKEIKIPILIINGDKDLQVQISDAETLHHSNPKSELVIIENMNHILKDIQKDEDNASSYSSPNFPVSKQLIKVIYNFVTNKD